MCLTAHAGLLVTAERGVRRVQVVAVGPHAARLDRTAHAVGAVDVAGPHAGAEAELGVVGNRQGFGFVLEGGDAHHRAKDFFLEHAHFVGALEQGRLDVITTGHVAAELLDLAAGQQLRAFAFGDFQVGQDLVELLLGRLGADHGVGVQRVAAFDLLDLLHHHFHEVVVDRLFYQRAGRAGAHFALVEECQHQAFGGLFDERRLSLHDVGEEDVRRLAAQFDGGRNNVLGRRVHDVRAHRRGAGEGDLGDAFAGGQGFAGFFAETVHHVQHAWRQQVADQLHQHADAQRGLFSGFEHHAVTGGQGRRQFPRGHQQWEVPRDDLADHAQRFVEVVRRGQFVDLGAGAFLGADATGEVAEVVSGQRDVGVEGFPHGLAVVPGFGDGQQFEVLFDAVGNFQQHQRTVLSRGLAPGICGGMGGVEGFVDVFGSGAREFGDGLAVDRRGVGEVVAIHRRNEFAADVVTVLGLERNDRAFSTGMCITHGGYLLTFMFIGVQRCCA